MKGKEEMKEGEENTQKRGKQIQTSKMAKRNGNPPQVYVLSIMALFLNFSTN